MSKNKVKRGASQRQLKVGEVLRHALAEIFTREPLYEPELKGQSITVSEVKVSPDLRNATVYVTSLGGRNEDSILSALNRIVPDLRKSIAARVQLRFAPQFVFRLDPTFSQAAKIDTLLRQVKEPKDMRELSEVPGE